MQVMGNKRRSVFSSAVRPAPVWHSTTRANLLRHAPGAAQGRTCLCVGDVVGHTAPDVVKEGSLGDKVDAGTIRAICIGES